MIFAAFSAIMMVGALVLPRVRTGIIDASTIFRVAEAVLQKITGTEVDLAVGCRLIRGRLEETAGLSDIAGEGPFFVDSVPLGLRYRKASAAAGCCRHRH